MQIQKESHSSNIANYRTPARERLIFIPILAPGKLWHPLFKNLVLFLLHLRWQKTKALPSCSILIPSSMVTSNPLVTARRIARIAIGAPDAALPASDLASFINFFTRNRLIQQTQRQCFRSTDMITCQHKLQSPGFTG